MIDLNTGRRRPVMAQDPVLSTAQSKWHGVSLEQHRGGSVETLDFMAPHHVIVVQLATTAQFDFRNGFGPFRRERLKPGQLLIFPAMAPHSLRTPDVGEFLALRLDPQFVLCAAQGLITSGDYELTTRFGAEDSYLHAGALALKAEAEAGSPGGRVYAESLAAALAVHLVRHYSTRKPRVEHVSGGLTRLQLRSVIDFIHAHIEEDISLATLTHVVGLSPFHFTRVFKQSTGLAPHQFIIRCRVEKARELLLAGKPLVNIALSVGFCDQSHLTAHFKRVFGMTPNAFRRQMSPSLSFSL